MIKYNGNVLDHSTYTITYAKGRKNPGTYKVIVKMKGTKITVKWKKQAKQVTGYQIQYSTSSDFSKNNKRVAVKSAKTISKTIKGLKSKKKYYVRIRTYKKANGKNYFSAWSAKKSIKTK